MNPDERPARPAKSTRTPTGAAKKQNNPTSTAKSAPDALHNALHIRADDRQELTAALRPLESLEEQRGPLDTNYVFTSRPEVTSTPSQSGKDPQKTVQKTGVSEAAEAPRPGDGEDLGAVDRLHQWAMLSAVREIVPEHRTALCARLIMPVAITGVDGVQVMHSPAHGERGPAARYGNLNRCSNVWACPRCSPRIAAKRAAELRGVLERHAAEGGRLMMMTLTHRHDREGTLAGQLAMQGAALEAMHRTRSFRQLCAGHGVVGTVRALEMTHSERAGWHVHVHALVLIAGTAEQAARHCEVLSDQDAKRKRKAGSIPTPREAVQVPKVRALPAFGRAYLKAWMTAADRAGLDAQPQAQRAEIAAADLATLERLADYLSKAGGAANLGAFGGAEEHRVALESVERANDKGAGGAAREMTGAALKLARSAGGASPFELLSDYTKSGRGRAGQLFAEYAHSTAGRRALSYSNGLKALYELEEQTDEDAAHEEQRPEETELARLTRAQWSAILKAPRTARGRVLEIAREGDAARLAEFLALLTGEKIPTGDQPAELHADQRAKWAAMRERLAPTISDYLEEHDDQEEAAWLASLPPLDSLDDFSPVDAWS